MKHTSGIAAVYGAALLQGAALVSFPVSSAVLRASHGFTDAQYGAIFLPQVAFAVIGSVLGGALAPRIGLRVLLVLAMLGNALSQLLLASTMRLDPAMAYTAVLMGTASMGLGFGLLGAPMNAYPALLFPGKRETALVAVHTLVGIGLTVGPVAFDVLHHRSSWTAYALSLLGLCLTMSVLGAFSSLPGAASPVAPDARRSADAHPLSSPTFWAFFTIAAIYAFAEGTFSNWIVVYLQDGRQLPASVATAALSGFWGALVAGRLLVSVLVLRVPAPRIWIALPVLMAATFLALPHAEDAALGIGLFAMAGLACSAFFPLSIALVSQRFPGHVALVSSMMTAALMCGVGLGSFAVGALRARLAFESLYALSSIYPIAVLVVATFLLRRERVRPALATARAREIPHVAR